MTGPRRRAATTLAVGLVAVVAALGACGVEVPDDVADDLRDTTTTVAAPSTTETPMSDDELEQALIDNGYTQAESACGAANLREALGEDGIRSIIDADTIEDISGSTARAFADALQPCVENGAGGGETPGEEPPGDDDDRPGGLGQMPDFGDDSEGDVSRSRFLASLISAGVEDGAARCIVDEIYAELDQDDINILFHARSEREIPDDLLDAVTDINETCLG